MADIATEHGNRNQYFLGATPDPVTGKVISHAERLRNAVEEIVLADQVGLDVYGIGEHHRADYAGTSPAVVLAAAAAMTKRIRLHERRNRVVLRRPGSRISSFLHLGRHL